MDLQCPCRVGFLVLAKVTFSEFELQRCFHHLGAMQMGWKGTRVHPREGMTTSFDHLHVSRVFFL
jgi:hypothetical protein